MLELEVSAVTCDFDEDDTYSYLKSLGYDEIDADRIINDEIHGLSMGISDLIK